MREYANLKRGVASLGSSARANDDDDGRAGGRGRAAMDDNILTPFCDKYMMYSPDRKTIVHLCLG